MAADDDAWMGSPSARDPAFRIVEGPRGAPVVFEVQRDLDADEERPLYDLWGDLPMFSGLLESVGPPETAQLAFAAIDWTDRKVAFGPSLATVGIAVTRVFDMISVCVDERRLGWFTCPELRLDIFGRPRMWFWPPARGPAYAARLPPEAIERWPAADERSLVHCVGRLLLGLTVVSRAELATPLGSILRRCMMTDPQRRYRTLKSLRNALREAGGLATSEMTMSESAVEQGIGYLLRSSWDHALAMFEAAGATFMRHPAAAEGRRIARLHGGKAPLTADVVPEPPRRRSWADMAPTALALERQRDYRGAVALYLQTADDGPHRPQLYLALARCHLALGDHGHAVDYARRALALSPISREAHMLIAKGLIARREYSHAHDAIAAWEKLRPDDAAMHYARGKVLVGQHQFADAVAAFDKAIAKDGTMIEAMLLRREADRHARRGRAEVGTQMQPAIAAELAALIAGEPAAAIDTLRGERFVTDPIAQLVLAQLLAAEQRYAEALEVFVACTDHADISARALCGAAAMLIELDRAGEALELLADATALEAFELRVRALKQLGRGDDANAEQRRFDARLASLSELRVRNSRDS